MEDKATRGRRATLSSPRKRTLSECIAHVKARNQPLKKHKVSGLSRGAEISDRRRAKSLELLEVAAPVSMPTVMTSPVAELGVDKNLPLSQSQAIEARPPGRATFESLPYELKAQIFQELLVTDAAIQPIDHMKTRLNNLPIQERSRIRKRRNLNLGAGLLSAAKWTYEQAVDTLYRENQFDFSETELGAMTLRKFRRRCSKNIKAKIQHVVIGARIIKTDPSREFRRKQKIKLHRIRTAEDNKFVSRLNDGATIANIAQSFPSLKTLEIRLNVKDWTPQRRVHWDLFGDNFEGLRVVRPQNWAVNDFSKITKYGPDGDVVTEVK